ncbi:hypothetical protein ABB37_07342 [Leptomonas pyrrhocoris]|uniref:CCHC-type domain-containing protein n=1 Tax=Leptomonas pyrrhocoris TaxID=157538 RepID=A0A0M9FVS8_LEPPY|nr:hypothetical protein ABB37_07342 [Leptomonas pyrrhocoris]XP_015655418.1 hypothetical protein ABB37_07342 [Leptomonas pyrrhocoris]KPA76978.1 hypothetical protein ABB37_07342 [Leptomonas pyrrhocoris]KPA76979.1 hypothetical protein ABB37_07342 [Leptomonas pyrrhocoris]|eukprot:XP_015655417.1 hypothetical protein ABB37_07342 [Leptomonas pyrrhocoris]
MLCQVGMCSGRLMLFDGTTNTTVMWSSCELPFTQVEFVAPEVQQRMGELYQIMRNQGGRLQSLEQQQGMNANAITSALSSLQVNTTSALERHASAAASAVSASLAFSAGRDADIVTQLQAVTSRLEFERKLALRERERVAQVELRLSRMVQSAGRDSPELLSLRSEVARLAETVRTLQDELSRARDAAAADRLARDVEVARLKEQSVHAEKRFEERLNDVKEAQKQYPDQMDRIERLLTTTATAGSDDEGDGATTLQWSRDVTARLVKVQEAVTQTDQNLSTLKDQYTKFAFHFGTKTSIIEQDMKLLEKRVLNDFDEMRQLLAKTQPGKTHLSRPAAAEDGLHSVRITPPSPKHTTADATENSDEEDVFDVTGVRTWRSALEGLTWTEVDIALRKLFFDGQLNAPTAEAQGCYSSLLDWVQSAQQVPSLFEYQAGQGNDHVSRLTVALKSNAFPELTYAKLATARRDRDTGIDALMGLIKTIAPAKKSGVKKGRCCFNCGSSQHLAAQCPARGPRSFSGSRKVARAYSAKRSTPADTSKNQSRGTR